VRHHTNADDRWIPEEEYQLICSRVPILCVDLLSIVDNGGHFGLIERDTYGGKRGLNLIGGSVLLDEPIPDALDRHLRASLGRGANLDHKSVRFVGVYQYYKEAREGQLHDPRKNAVSLTYSGKVSGPLSPAGEALAFHKFPVTRPPGIESFGFGQGPVVYDGLALITSGASIAE
jgi:hypothetical protein